MPSPHVLGSKHCPFIPYLQQSLKELVTSSPKSQEHIPLSEIHNLGEGLNWLHVACAFAPKIPSLLIKSRHISKRYTPNKWGLKSSNMTRKTTIKTSIAVTA